VTRLSGTARASTSRMRREGMLKWLNAALCCTSGGNLNLLAAARIPEARPEIASYSFVSVPAVLNSL
jgi:hypothetical protein